MPKQFEVRYRWSWLDLSFRAEIFDGERWLRLSAQGTEIQKRADNLKLETDAILAAMRS